MVNVVQLQDKEWRDIANPADLCRIGITTSFIEETINIKFTEYVEDGLGPARYAVVGIDEQLVIFRHLEYSPDDILCRMRSNESDCHSLLLGLQKALGIPRSEFVWVRKRICEPEWHVWINADGIQTEVASFHEKHSADYFLSVYERENNVGGEIRYQEGMTLQEF